MSLIARIVFVVGYVWLTMDEPAVLSLLWISVAEATGTWAHSNATHLKPRLPDILIAVDSGRITIKGYVGGFVCAVAHIG